MDKPVVVVELPEGYCRKAHFRLQSPWLGQAPRIRIPAPYIAYEPSSRGLDLASRFPSKTVKMSERQLGWGSLPQRDIPRENCAKHLSTFAPCKALLPTLCTFTKAKEPDGSKVCRQTCAAFNGAPFFWQRASPAMNQIL